MGDLSIGGSVSRVLGAELNHRQSEFGIHTMSEEEISMQTAIDDIWKRFEVHQGESASCHLGPLNLRIQRFPHLWTLTYFHFEDSSDGSSEITIGGSEKSEEAQEGTTLRVVAADASNAVSLSPRLADRSLVARPETALHVLPGASITLYVSSPVWVAVQVGEPPQQVLDVSSRPQSDTWFGPTTTQGEFCYALRSNARLNPEKLPLLKHRAVTQLRLENTTPDIVSLERLTLPVQNLALYVDAKGYCWSQSLTVMLTNGGSSVEVDFGKGPPAELHEPKQVAEPRVRAQRNILLRARNALFI